VTGVALIGCAHRPHAWSYARALASSSTARLVGVHDPFPEIGEPIAADLEVAYHRDATELIASPGVDAVVVCSPTVQHRALVERAAALGRHVLCEKPLATTIADAQAMVTACQQAGVQLHTAFVSRFHPLVERVRAALRDGQIGEPLAVVGANRGRPPLPPEYPPWITDREQSGGGALMDHSVHLTDVVRHLSGQEVHQVSAEVGAQLANCGIDDVALLSLVFSGGLVASLDPSWSVPRGNPWDYDFSLRVLGTTGSVDINDLAESLQLVSTRAEGGLRLVPFGIDVDQQMIEAFVASVRAGELLDPCATGIDGLRALEVALAGYASAAARQPVHLPQTTGSSVEQQRRQRAFSQHQPHPTGTFS
jgi:predicted dehydrogenase